MTDRQPAAMMVVKFKSGLPPDRIPTVIEARIPDFQVLPGLLQKYFVRETATGDIAGIYLWDSQESLEAYRTSELRKSIPPAYRIVGEPRIEIFDVLDVLRS